MRTNKHRETILTILKNQHGGLTATGVHSALPEVNLTTIYRNLDSLTLTGTIKKMFLDSGEALYEYQDHPHHHAVCDDCHRVIHFTAPDEKIKKLLGLTDFEIHDLEVTVRGTCNHKIA
jgi:Fur family transcriptional regulator, peroxide stress response regulator